MEETKTKVPKPVVDSPANAPQRPRPALRKSTDILALGSFEWVYQQEAGRIDPDYFEFVCSQGTAGEPWISFTTKDRFGVALSGGGVRSATFNLGLLQSMAQLNVLGSVDYLATVSGGGYTGGFWTAWLHRNLRGENRQHASKSDRTAYFPLGNEQTGEERSEIRHLREFSRFLLPRIGIMETELWSIVMTVLGGVVPSLFTALSVLVLAWCGAFGIWELISPFKSDYWASLRAFALLNGFFALTELTWSQQRRSESNRNEVIGYWAASSVATTVCVLAWSSRAQWREVLWNGTSPFESPAITFLPAVVAGGVMMGLLMLRSLIARRFEGEQISALVGIERAMTRMVALSAALFSGALLWTLAASVYKLRFGIGVTSVGAGSSLGGFLVVRKWLSEPPRNTNGGELLRNLASRLKRATPKLLATIAVVLILVLIGTGICWGHELGYRWSIPGAAILVLFSTLISFDPARVGMHEFYRSRIARCYLGASNRDRSGAAGAAGKPASQAGQAAENRFCNERAHDDLSLGDLAKTKGLVRPFHLVCTAANDLSGDQLGTLYRGARSAVLSLHGVTLGDDTTSMDRLRLSSALTASAAAFNSQMGRISVDLGPAVTFLMTAFNLRLGLWVPRPKQGQAQTERVLLPGLFLLSEMFGRSNTDGDYLHLSDGNHFENFGLYELVRRHCRYLVVSDCGADPEVAFDDLANVIRRVREDFGVEIELEIDPLRPGEDGLAKQHGVVGTVHYNGLGGMDKGTILYLKPALTRDEPPDVLQYHTRNQAFPHEPTSDQFYDEAQWESYRRLGEHSGRVILGFLDRRDPPPVDQLIGRMFRDARSRWHPAPVQMSDQFVAMSARCSELESNLTADGPTTLLREFYSEAAEIADGALPDGSPDEEFPILSFLLRALQIMEDVWLTGRFEQYWSHPLNEGWMHYFHRWASTPSFRRWWPLLAPIYSLGFREFVSERLGAATVGRSGKNQQTGAQEAKLTLRELSDPTEYAASGAWQRFCQMHPGYSLHNSRGWAKKVFGSRLELLDREGKPTGPGILIGFVLVTESENPPEHGLISMHAEWNAEEFFIPPSIHGGGMVSRLLDDLINHYRSLTAPPDQIELRVCFGGDAGKAPGRKAWKPKLLGPAARYERVQDIEFYKSRGFRYRAPEDPETGEIRLHFRIR